VFYRFHADYIARPTAMAMGLKVVAIRFFEISPSTVTGRS
jgi:hypothetical protein